MNLFKQKVNTKNYLRAYCNIGRTEFTNKDKENLIDTFKEIAVQILKFTNVKYDIHGFGYGISKSSQLLNDKVFESRLNKIGYSKLYGISIMSENKYIMGFDKIR